MPFDIQIPLQKRLIGVIVPLSIMGLYLTSNSDSRLQRMVGTHFSPIAQTDAAVTSQFINDRVVEVSALAAEPSIVDAVSTSNHSHERMSDEAIAAREQNVEEQWDTPNADSLVKEMLPSRTSRWLQHQRTLDPRLLKIIVADATGANVAATDKPLHYVEAYKEHWRFVYTQGKGAVNVTEVRYDEHSKSNYIKISVPVLEEGSGRFIGAVSALVDISGLFLLLNQQQIGRTGRVLLVKDDGRIISAPNVTALKLMSEVHRRSRRAHCRAGRLAISRLR